MALIDINWKPAPRQLRDFGWAGSVVLVAVGWLQYRWGGLPSVILVIACAVGLGIGAFFWPRCLRPLYVGLQVVSFPVPWLGSQLLLAIIYFGVFSIVGFLFRLLRRDALQRRFEPQATSYWQPKPMSSDLRQYLKQF